MITHAVIEMEKKKEPLIQQVWKCRFEKLMKLILEKYPSTTRDVVMGNWEKIFIAQFNILVTMPPSFSGHTPSRFDPINIKSSMEVPVKTKSGWPIFTHRDVRDSYATCSEIFSTACKIVGIEFFSSGGLLHFSFDFNLARDDHQTLIWQAILEEGLHSAQNKSFRRLDGFESMQNQFVEHQAEVEKILVSYIFGDCTSLVAAYLYE